MECCRSVNYVYRDKVKTVEDWLELDTVSAGWQLAKPSCFDPIFEDANSEPFPKIVFAQELHGANSTPYRHINFTDYVPSIRVHISQYRYIVKKEQHPEGPGSQRSCAIRRANQSKACSRPRIQHSLMLSTCRNNRTPSSAEFAELRSVTADLFQSCFGHH